MKKEDPRKGGEDHQLTRGAADDVQPAWSPDGKRIAFSRASTETGKLEPGDLFGAFHTGGDLWLLDLERDRVEKLVERAYSPAWSPDGKQLAFDAHWAGPPRIWISDARGRNPRQVTTDTSEAVDHVEPAWSPDGARILYRRIEKSKSDLQVVDLRSATATPVTDDHFRDLHAQWSPDGKAIYFSSFRGGGQNIWRQPVSRDGSPASPAEQLTTGAGNDVMLAISPDGARLSFVILGINSDLWRLPLDPASGFATGPPAPLVSTGREDTRGHWSPDSSKLAFSSDRGGSMSIWIKRLADGTERQLTRGSGGDYQPTWAPDGEHLVFFSSRSGNVDIWSVDVATGKLVQLTDDPAVDEDPLYSPTGEHIAFQSDRDGRLEVWVMRTDGSEPRRVSSTGTAGHFMRWTDDGAAVIHRVPDGPLHRTPLDGSPSVALAPTPGAGSHISFSPDRAVILDVSGHKTLWAFPAAGGERMRVFEFEDPDIRIDYAVWSPDGRWAVFDRAVYQGADLWVLSGLR